MSFSFAEKQRAAFGYLYAAEMELMTKLAKALPEEAIIVNIGAGAGTSGLMWVEARPDATLYTIDIQDESSPYGCLEGERQLFAEAGLSYLLNQSWFQVHGDSVEVGARWMQETGKLVDLVFIDGNHSYAGCLGDIEVWLGNLVMGGTLIVHDYLKATRDPTENGKTKPYVGVDKAVRERLIERGYPILGEADTTIAFRKDRL